MSANETVHTSATGGQKAGNDERYDLIPAEPLRRLAIHAGQTVCAPRGGSYHQMMSHAWAFWAGEEMDMACDWPHLIAAAWEAFRIVQPDWRPPGWVLDDRRPGETRYDRIPPDALRQLAKHFGVGAKKYDDDNWTRGYDWRLTFAAANRHAEQWRAGEEFDPETGSHHLIAFAWHMLVLDEFTRINRGGDTRYCTKVRRWLDAEKAWRASGGDRRELHFGIRVNNVEELQNAMRCHSATTRAPRVVQSLGDNERDAEWTSKLGRYRWDDEKDRWMRLPANSEWHGDHWIPTMCRTHECGPFTEVRAPRVVDQLTEEHNDADWMDRDGTRWGWRKHSHGPGWVTIHETGYPTAGWRLRGTSPSMWFGPFSEILP